MYKHLIAKLRQYIFIILTATIISTTFFSKSFSEENVFVVDNINVEGIVNLNFTRDKYIEEALVSSFDKLKSRILLTRDLNKLNNIGSIKIKNLIDRFQIVEEIYQKDKYFAKFKIYYNDNKIKELLSDKNISFSQPRKISAIFFPILFIDDEMQNFDENYFFKEWNNNEIENESINFILPLEDLDDIYKIKEMKNNIGELDGDDLVNKYNIKNYTFAIMNYDKKKLNIHVKTNFDNNKMSKNISYQLENIKDEIQLNLILIDLKKQITDLWKEANIVNLLMPLSINVKFKNKNIKDFDKIKKIFYNISIIKKYTLEEFNINNSFFKIYYYGSPKRLKAELLKFGYELRNEQGFWELYSNE